MSNFILMWLEGPLQSWGVDSKFYNRDTQKFPTRSGILGMLFSGSGLFGEQKEALEKMKFYKQTILSFSKEGKEPEVLKDFQVIGSSYDETDKWERLMIPKTNLRRKASGKSGPKVIYKSYLQNASFAVILETPSEYLQLFEEGLKTPIGDLCLGRKNCIPTEFIYQGTYSNKQKAINKGFEIATMKELLEVYRIEEGKIDDEIESLTISDVPLKFREQKNYSQRIITIIRN